MTAPGAHRRAAPIPDAFAGPAPVARTVDVDGVPLAYDDTGRGDPPLVFVHGMFNTREMWRPQVERFSACRRVITYDLRSHGGSGGDRLPFTFDALADELAGLIEHLGAAPAVVCGFSAGGCVAQVLARRRPDLLAGLAISDSIAGVDARGAALAGKGLLWLSSRLLSRRGTVALTTLPTWSMDRDVRRYFQRSAYANLRRLDKDRIREVAASLFDFRRQDLSSFDRPTLVMAGEREPRFVRRQAEALGRAIPGAELQLLTGAQHGPNLENAAAFDDALLSLLERVDRRYQRAA